MPTRFVMAKLRTGTIPPIMIPIDKSGQDAA